MAVTPVLLPKPQSSQEDVRRHFPASLEKQVSCCELCLEGSHGRGGGWPAGPEGSPSQQQKRAGAHGHATSLNETGSDPSPIKPPSENTAQSTP